MAAIGSKHRACWHSRPLPSATAHFPVDKDLFGQGHFLCDDLVSVFDPLYTGTDAERDFRALRGLAENGRRLAGNREEVGACGGEVQVRVKLELLFD
jgi:hypothetical protein